MGFFKKVKWFLLGLLLSLPLLTQKIPALLSFSLGLPSRRSPPWGLTKPRALVNWQMRARGFSCGSHDGECSQNRGHGRQLGRSHEKGGPVMVPIVGLGLAAVMIALLKWLQLSRIRLATPADLKLILAHLNAGHPEKASAHVASFKGQVGEVLRSALEHRKESKAFLEELMYEKMLSAKPALERFIALIALTAATAPLLGLLGTVTGMINTFNMITVFGTGDPRMLSGGISEALITTKFGLVVAVPALICHAFVTRKVKGVLGSMEQVSIGFINGLPDAQEAK